MGAEERKGQQMRTLRPSPNLGVPLGRTPGDSRRGPERSGGVPAAAGVRTGVLRGACSVSGPRGTSVEGARVTAVLLGVGTLGQEGRV